MEEGVKRAFGVAITAANVQLVKRAHSHLRREFCICFALGFGAGQQVGETVFHAIRKSVLDSTTFGLGTSSQYGTYEETLKTQLLTSYPSLTQEQADLYAITAAGVIFGYTFNTNMGLDDVFYYIGGIYAALNQRIIGIDPFPISNDGTINHPFTAAYIKAFLSSRNYSQVYAQIASSTKTADIDMVSINWYNSEPLFAGPNLQKMKDSENQYYFVSGRLQFPDLPTDIPECEEVEFPISTPFGRKNIVRYLEVPCRNPEGYVGPPTGMEFYRLFNDGPYSSGNFSKSVRNEYKAFDTGVLSGYDINSNGFKLYSYFVGGDGNPALLANVNVYVDGGARIDLTQEYASAPAPADCGGYVKMHVGGTGIWTSCSNIDTCGGCDSQPTGHTGFKFAPIQLNYSNWQERFKNLRINPQCSPESFARRSLNIDSNPYVGTELTGKLFTYTQASEVDPEIWYAGPPQLLGSNSLPYFAFYQDFESVTFNKQAKIVMFAARGDSAGGTSRSWTISPTPLASGTDTNSHPVTLLSGEARAKFESTISSTGNHDITTQQVLGIGNGMDGSTVEVFAEEEQAGYTYTGYIIRGPNGIVSGSAEQILVNYENYIIGSQSRKVRYISGYSGLANVSLNKIFGIDGSGNQQTYYYFDNRKNGINIQQSGWDRFAPTPNFDGTEGYERIYAEQNNENYFPRFSKGPYAVIEKKFLYPNAENSSGTYSVLRGFPLRTRFRLKVREQAIKEFYGRYKISEGVVAPNIERTRVVRPQPFGYALGNLQNLFDGSGDFTYDFNLWKTDDYGFNLVTGTNMVDNLWAPVFAYIPGVPPQTPTWSTGRNPAEYNNAPTFNQGILLTGDAGFYVKRFYNSSGNFVYDWMRLNPGVGLYNYFTGRTITGFLRYTKPVFSLKFGEIDATDAADTIPIVNLSPCEGGHVGGHVSPFTSTRFFGEAGQDPLYFEFINGRRGGPNAEDEGGYHSQGLNGDKWMFFNAINYGTYCQPWPISQCSPSYHQRIPYEDRSLVLVNSTLDQTQIHTRAMNFTPFVTQYAKPSAFTSITQITGNKALALSITSGAVKLDLASIFPIRQASGTGYYQNSTGLIVGPFDRDVEIYTTGNIYPFSTLFVNDEVMVDYFGCSAPVACDNHGLFLRTGLLRLIPSGETLRLNISSNSGCMEDISWAGDYQTGIGLHTGSHLFIRARGALTNHSYDSTLDESYWNNFLYDMNGLEKRYDISHSGGFEGLLGTREFVVFTRSGKLYPKPDETDFGTYQTIDVSGNAKYPTIEDYWKAATLTGGYTVYASGWREGARISFEFEEVEVTYDDFPYNDHSLIVPTGRCVITGIMGYHGQADNGVFTEGIELKDNSNDLSMVTGFFGPNFYSPVLERVPGYNPPTATFNQPVEEAPSMMVRRLNKLFITHGQEYEKLLTEGPQNYNKFDWAALSDLKILNPDETIDDLPPDDGNTFLNSNMVISAAQGQLLADGTKNPDGRKIYDVVKQFQMYDTVATDPLLNSGIFLTTGRGRQIRLRQPDSGYLVPKGTSINNIKSGMY